MQYFHTFHAPKTNATYEAKGASIHKMHSDSGNCTASCSEECISSINKEGNIFPCKKSLLYRFIPFTFLL